MDAIRRDGFDSSGAEHAGPWEECRAPNDDGEYFARVVAAARSVLFTPGAWSWYRPLLDDGAYNLFPSQARLSRELRAEARRLGGSR